jgi:hypothetical protein
MEGEKLKLLVDALTAAERQREVQLSTVMRPVITPDLAGAVLGARLGVMQPTPMGSFGVGATLGGEVVREIHNGELQTGPVRGLDLQFQDEKQRFGIGAHDGPRGTRWGIQYGRKF